MSVMCETVEERCSPYYSKKLVNCMVMEDNIVSSEKRVVTILETSELPKEFAKNLMKLEI
jgi:hypothetical protein